MITIKEMQSKKEMKQFVKFPFKLYKTSKYWVPPIINGQLEAFDPKINPVFENAKARFFVAIKNGEIAGRIVAIINSYDIQQKENKIRFGWFDFIDDYEVSKMLLKKVEEIGVQNKLEFMEGPMGFSNLDEVGVLTKGFDEIGTLASWYNYPYYRKHLEKLDFVIRKRYVENRFPFENVDDEKLERVSAIVKKRYGFKPMNFTKTSELMDNIDEMFDVFNKSFAPLASFVPVEKAQVEYYKKKFFSFLNPKLIKFVLDENDKMIGFGITMPTFSTALQKAKGKLFPFGWYHLLKAKNSGKSILFYIIGALPEHQNKGVPSIIFSEFFKTLSEMGTEYCIRTPELNDNKPVVALWSGFGQETYKERCTFKKDI